MAYFDHFAKSSPTKVSKIFSLRAMQKVFKIIKTSYAKSRPIFLEIGPGKGEFASFVVGNKCQYIAIEANNEMALELSKKGIEVLTQMVPPFNIPDSSVDIVCALDFFEHLPDYQSAIDFIKECKRVLKKGGVVCILSPDYLNWKEDFFNCDFTHNNVTTPRRLTQLFEDSNINPVKLVYFSSFFTGPIAFLTSSFNRLLNTILSTLSLGMFPKEKLYKAKLMFLRRFLIIGVSE